MKESIRVAAVQPPVPEGEGGHDRCARQGLELADAAARAGARIICLPEYLGVWGLPSKEWRARVRSTDSVLRDCVKLARRRGAVVLCPSVEVAGPRLFNTTWVVGPAGRIVGRYRKVHLTLSERENMGLSAGSFFPVFSALKLRFGVMTCYDGYFPECARILALKKAHVIFWPSLQRAATEEVISLQARSRALDNCVYIVRASYGYPRDVPWRPGMMVGLSAVVDWEGRIVANLGHREGFVVHDIPLGNPPPRPRSFQGPSESPRRFLFEDRQPALYSPLCRPPKEKR